MWRAKSTAPINFTWSLNRSGLTPSTPGPPRLLFLLTAQEAIQWLKAHGVKKQSGLLGCALSFASHAHVRPLPQNDPDCYPSNRQICCSLRPARTSGLVLVDHSDIVRLLCTFLSAIGCQMAVYSRQLAYVDWACRTPASNSHFENSPPTLDSSDTAGSSPLNAFSNRCDRPTQLLHLRTSCGIRHQTGCF